MTTLSTAPTPAAALLDRMSINRDHPLARLTLVVLGSWLMAACAQLAIPLTPVPITMQSFGVLLIAAALGFRLGFAATLLYLAQGLVGLPFFSGGGAGLVVLKGATGGYLVGFLLAAAFVGWCTDRGWTRRIAPCVGVMTLAKVCIFVPGLLWLSTFTPEGGVLAAGLWPFVPGAFVKIALAAALLPAAWRIVGRSRAN